jgi:hypothetical protein
MPIRRIATLFAALLLALPLSAQLPPDAEWRTLDTPHFRVHFTPALEPLARRAADRAETAYAALAEALVRPPRGRIDLVLSDNVDYANGYATPIPSNRIVIFAHPPVDTPELAFYDDWLQLVITHELTHTFHLDYADGVARWVRRVFGRTVPGFPHLLVPRWTQEGLATLVESRLTRAGRVRATLYDMGLRTAVLEDRFFSIDRASGQPVSWPAGATPYVYGSLFMDYLGDRFGDSTHTDWVRRVGRRIPFTYGADAAARGAYGVSFSRAWREWGDSLRVEYGALADSLRREGLTEPEVLVREGRRTEAPRWSPDGRTLSFSQATGRDEPSTRLWSEGEVRVLDPRTSLGPSAWREDGSLVTAMLDAVDPYRTFADLYMIHPNGDRDRLTEGARLQDPDVHRPTGRIVAVRGGGGTTVPVVLEADGSGARALVPASPDVHWTRPRWSPDGRQIAIARWRPGALYDVVVLDAATGRVVRQLTDDRAVDTSPAWSPDGRYVLFSSDRSGISDLYAYDLQGGRLLRVTRVLTGAFEPDVSPDGRWIAMTLYRSDGFHLARIPFDPASWRPAGPVRAEVREPGNPEVSTRTAGGPARPYSPWRSLLPTSWNPLFSQSDALGTGVGAAVFGQDLVGRHSFGAALTLYPGDGRADGSAAYLYAGLGNPVLGASLVQDWDELGTVRTAGGDLAQLLERERSASLVGTAVRRRLRSYSWASAGGSVRERHYAFDDGRAGAPELPAEAGAALTLGHSTTRRFEYSVSPEQGFVAAASLAGRRYLDALPDGRDGRSYVRATGRAQHYLPLHVGGYARHVLAARVSGGVDRGAFTPGYTLGGYEGGAVSASPLSTFIPSGGRLELPVRGYRDGLQFGDRAVAGTLEYRFPIALVERGYRLLPVYLDRLWGTAFVDAGRTECSADCLARFTATPPARATLVSAGAEFGFNVGLSYSSAIPFRAGVGVPLTAVDDGTGTRTRPDPRAYFTVGLSF